MENESSSRKVVYAVAAVRVSSSRQNMIGDSPEHQKEQILRRVTQVSELMGCEIKIRKWFELVESANVAFEVQPVLKVLDYSADPINKIELFFVKSIDRQTRGGATIYGQIKANFARYGIQIIDTLGIIDPRKVNTLEHLGVKFSWSEYSPSHITEILEAERANGEVRDILTRLIGSEIRYVKLGYRVRAAPFGYKNVRIETEHGLRMILEPRLPESKWIEMMYELRAQGNFTDEEIVRRINADGFKSRIQKVRNSENKIIGYRGGKPLSVKQFLRYLKNPIYAAVNTEKWTNDNPIKERFHGIVAIEKFNLANRGKLKIIENEGKIAIVHGEIPPWQTVKKGNNPDYPYKKYVICPFCSHFLKGSASKGKSGKYFPAYHCSLGHKSYRIPVAVFNKTINSFVSNLVFGKDFVERFQKITLEEWEKRRSIVNSSSIAAEKRVLELKIEHANVSRRIMMVESPIAIKAIEKELERIDFELAEAKLIRNSKEDTELDIQTLINYAKYYMEHLRELLFSGTNPHQNAAMFGLLFEKIPNYEEIKNGTPKLAPIFKLKEEFYSPQRLSVSDQGLEP